MSIRMTVCVRIGVLLGYRRFSWYSINHYPAENRLQLVKEKLVEGAGGEDETVTGTEFEDKEVKQAKEEEEVEEVEEVKEDGDGNSDDEIETIVHHNDREYSLIYIYIPPILVLTAYYLLVRVMPKVTIHAMRHQHLFSETGFAMLGLWSYVVQDAIGLMFMIAAMVYLFITRKMIFAELEDAVFQVKHRLIDSTADLSFDDEVSSSQWTRNEDATALEDKDGIEMKQMMSK